MIILFYSVLIALCVYMELSSKVNTDNILNKIGIGFIIVGSIIKIYAVSHHIPHENHLVCIGIFLHFICEINYGYKRKNRRMGDRVES